MFGKLVLYCNCTRLQSSALYSIATGTTYNPEVHRILQTVLVLFGTGATAAAPPGHAERLGGAGRAAEDGALVPHADAREAHHFLGAAAAATRTTPEPRGARAPRAAWVALLTLTASLFTCTCARFG